MLTCTAAAWTAAAAAAAAACWACWAAKVATGLAVDGVVEGVAGGTGVVEGTDGLGVGASGVFTADVPVLVLVLVVCGCGCGCVCGCCKWIEFNWCWNRPGMLRLGKWLMSKPMVPKLLPFASLTDAVPWMEPTMIELLGVSSRGAPLCISY